jgi:hypothetical protein
MKMNQNCDNDRAFSFVRRRARTFLLVLPMIWMQLAACAVGGDTLEQPRNLVFLLAGQSNMVGQGESAELTGQLSRPQRDINYWSDGWVPLAPGHGNSSQEFGPELSFGRRIKDAFPNDSIYLIKYGHNGTALYNDWRPTDGPQYVKFMATAEAALADLAASGVEYELSGMLWMQGESDAKEGEALAYEQNLRNFIAHIRDVFGEPGLPFVIGRVLTYYGGDNGGAEIVRAAQAKVAESTPGVSWFDTDSFSVVDPVENPGHYGTQGQLEMGRAFADSILELLSIPAD